MNVSRDSVVGRLRQPARAVVGRLRQPEYTGANRCLPCTAVNVGIAAAGAGAVAAVGAPLLGAVGFGGALGAIWLRGYLVPGTPELTKRYLPERALALFGKAPGNAEPRGLGVGEVDPETYLLDAGVLVETPAGDDFAFAPDFAASWRAAAEDGAGATPDEGRRTDRDDLAALAALTGLDRHELSIDWRGGAGFAYAGEERIGHWESRPAFRADAAADRVLTGLDGDWADRPLAERSAVLGALRLFVAECPSCAGDVALEERVVESCCSSYDVVAGRCAGCDARLFELRLPASLAAASE
ncbi:hypothetical protein PN419_11525 [Halorubrum ezzemoulense]|uniref:Uncharacterized protein n=1 Tax=Halorubrum ezzemoulense TaxID=337243 RepID=A0A256J9P5_HALEZ|nr:MULTISPECIES: hypothetical protein [Halorubrum]MDB2264419.1 hypothetical protein [Halorubrum ezzemoulense]MDB2282385.1 hypothetical protein [Halorubrum ezzemoulense]MDB9249622.1 hypothetical protein [Halorubrum ezzemoulense]MDB9259412.1 hypothetical protein [Halorubrum ezzemoulense]MDB9262878.1 hypothetical protein [Halorubrum ezzemoulense]